MCPASSVGDHPPPRATFADIPSVGPGHSSGCEEHLWLIDQLFNFNQFPCILGSTSVLSFDPVVFCDYHQGSWNLLCCELICFLCSGGEQRVYIFKKNSILRWQNRLKFITVSFGTSLRTLDYGYFDFLSTSCH